MMDYPLIYTALGTILIILLFWFITEIIRENKKNEIKAKN